MLKGIYNISLEFISKSSYIPSIASQKITKSKITRKELEFIQFLQIVSVSKISLELFCPYGWLRVFINWRNTWLILILNTFMILSLSVPQVSYRFLTGLIDWNQVILRVWQKGICSDFRFHEFIGFCLIINNSSFILSLNTIVFVLCWNSHAFSPESSGYSDINVQTKHHKILW